MPVRRPRGENLVSRHVRTWRKCGVQTCPDTFLFRPRERGRGTRATYVVNPTARVSQIVPVDPVDPVDPLILILHSLSRKGISLNKALRILVIPRCSPIASASFALYGVLKHLVSRKCCVAGVRRGENLVDSEKKRPAKFIFAPHL